MLHLSPVPETPVAIGEDVLSGLLAGKVWHSALDPDLKPLAATLADIGDDDGTNVFPSVAFVCWRLGRSERAVQTGMSRLREMGVLVVVKEGGGRANPTEYFFDENLLPARLSWKEHRKRNPAVYANPAVDDTKPRSLGQETPQPTAPNPSVPVIHPSNTPLPPFALSGSEVGVSFDEFWKEYPRHEEKAAAKAAWGKLKQAERELALAGLKRKKNSFQWQKERGRYICYARRFLSKRMWEDEVDEIESAESRYRKANSEEDRRLGADVQPANVTQRN